MTRVVRTGSEHPGRRPPCPPGPRSPGPGSRLEFVRVRRPDTPGPVGQGPGGSALAGEERGTRFEPEANAIGPGGVRGGCLGGVVAGVAGARSESMVGMRCS